MFRFLFFFSSFGFFVVDGEQPWIKGKGLLVVTDLAYCDQCYFS